MPGAGGGIVERSGCKRNGASTRYCALFASFPAASLEHRLVTLEIPITAVLPWTAAMPSALSETTPDVASRAVNGTPPILWAGASLPPHERTRAAQATIEMRRMDPPEINVEGVPPDGRGSARRRATDRTGRSIASAGTGADRTR